MAQVRINSRRKEVVKEECVQMQNYIRTHMQNYKTQYFSTNFAANSAKYALLHSQYRLHGSCASNVKEKNMIYDVYPWTRVIRGGFAVIYKESQTSMCEMLLVQQRALDLKDAHLGPPKGAVHRTDTSVLVTAERELMEETGVDIYNPKWGAEILQTTLVFPREHLGEVIVYFIAVVTTQPTVICRENDPEISGYQWVTLDKLKFIKGVTQPTKLLFNEICNMEWGVKVEACES